jgi:hypothetical protein
MRTLKNQNDKPWICIGDFNETLHAWEKEGEVPKSKWQMDKLREALEFRDLECMGFMGDAFTSRNNSDTDETYLKEHLHRAVASRDWRRQFPTYKVTNADPRHSIIGRS